MKLYLIDIVLLVATAVALGAFLAVEVQSRRARKAQLAEMIRSMREHMERERGEGEPRGQNVGKRGQNDSTKSRC